MKSQQKLVFLIGGIFLFIFVLFLLNSKPRRDSGPSQPLQPLKPAPGDWKSQVALLTNNERQARQLEPLILNEELSEIARLHSADMVQRNYFNHVNLQGESPAVRATKRNYKWEFIGENIAAGYSSPQDVVYSWMNSTDHRKNILGTYKRIGVGVVLKADGTPMWTQMFSD